MEWSIHWEFMFFWKFQLVFSTKFRENKADCSKFFWPTPSPPQGIACVFGEKKGYNKTQQDFSKLITWGTFGSHLEALGVWRYKQAKVQVDHQAAETDVQPKEIDDVFLAGNLYYVG